MKFVPLCLVALAATSAGAAPAPKLAVSLTQAPLVMRLDKDEFRIAFGINGERCAVNGCYGLVRYRVGWKTAEGATREEVKQISYAVSPGASRTVTVDRQYFDTGEGQHTTDIVKVRVEKITCRDGVDARLL